MRLLIVGFETIEEIYNLLLDWSEEHEIYLFTIVIPVPVDDVVAEPLLRNSISYNLAKKLGAPYELVRIDDCYESVSKLTRRIDYIIGKRENKLARKIALNMSNIGKHGMLVD